MIITRIVGNAIDDPGRILGMRVERVSLDNQALTKRIHRVTTDHGRELGIRLPAGAPDLRDGDILAIDDRGAVLVSAEPTDVLVIAPRNMGEMGTVAHDLGNRHLPAQFEGDAMFVEYDPTVEAYLRRHEVPYSRRDRVMPRPFRHADHTH